MGYAWLRNARASWTRSLIPDLRRWYDGPGRGSLTYFSVQALTGHGQFQTYMVRIGKSQVDTCTLCTSGQTDDVDHTVSLCPALAQVRRNSTYCHAGESTRDIVGHMMDDAAAWAAGVYFLDAIMREKTRLEDARRARHDGTRASSVGRAEGAPQGALATQPSVERLDAPPQVRELRSERDP